MTTPSYTAFLANITATLAKHGYPQRRVALPLERMYETAYHKQLNFNKALALLQEQGISHEKTPEKVIFFDASRFTPAAADGAASDSADGEGLAAMMASAGEMLKSMSPEQLAEIKRIVEGMSDEEKAQLMKQAQDMGLNK